MFVINMRLATEIIVEYFIWIDALYLNQKKCYYPIHYNSIPLDYTAKL